MILLQNLLKDRRESVLMHRNQIFCSCGEFFAAISEAENHMVQHDRISLGDKTEEKIESYSLEVLDRFVDFAKHLPRFDDGMSPKMKSVEVPKRTVLVVLSEREIDAGHIRDERCVECQADLRSFKEMQSHYESRHIASWMPEKHSQVVTSKKEAEGLKGCISRRYHCPIPGCKYHILSGIGHFSLLKRLKQHYVKVHASKSLSCSQCSSKFSSDGMLRRHERICGRKFECFTCGASYSALENLQTHGRRKQHVIQQQSEKTPKHKEKSSAPSLMHLHAAITLSQLSTKRSVTVATQTDALLKCGKRSAESQTRPKRFCKRSKPSSGLRDESLGLVLWTSVGSTQTSPKPCLAQDEEDAPFRGSADVLLSDEVLVPGSRPPRIVDIEQFSTETQTGAADWDLADLVTLKQIEAETQFDIDDILCSNYTQTADIFPSVLGGSGSMSSAETQTAHFILASSPPDFNNRAVTTNMETQTN